VVRIDGWGICNTPGRFEQYSLQEAKDYYDAIEWLGKQPWSKTRVLSPASGDTGKEIGID
jgi:predicted acyl esterase